MLAKDGGHTAETPPRAWGRPSALDAFTDSNGNTPTCVGKTLPAASRHTSTRKHPHVRGEDALQTSEETNQGETPPRAWGRPPEPLRQRAGCRNTPTCVGKTAAAGRMTRSSRKHPHVRGEDVMELTKDRNGVETPPRAWGRLEWFVSNTVHKRNTPTCVGKTKRVFYTTLPHQKHPHVRGEDGLSYRNRLIEAETPPRAWGRLTTHSIRQQKPRNTPTCVGKTSKVGKWYIVAKKHPHVRGEDTNIL